MPLPILFDAVVFDLDGTLIATDRFWIQAARTGARRAFDELGLDRSLPSAEEWMSLVGHSLEAGFGHLFADLPAAKRTAVMEACVEEEQRLLSAGGAALMPGAGETLDSLAEEGLCLALASNCSRAYLDHMLAFGLEDHVQAAFCLDSAGIGTKADMVAAALERFDTRSAVMVGDRSGDRDAAWENGLPHVHCSFGFAGVGEAVAAEGTIEDLGELVPRLRQRAAWIAAALGSIGVGADGGEPLVIGITGEPAAGKSLFARDAVRLLAGCEVEATTVALDDFRRPGRPEGPAEPEALFDLERLETACLEPFRRGSGGPRDPERGSVLLLEGPFLLDPRLRSRIDRVIHLEIPEDLLWRRLGGREARAQGPEALTPWREVLLPSLAEHRSRYAPDLLADLVLDASNPLGESRSPVA